MEELKQALRRELRGHFRVREPLADDSGLFSGGLIDSLSVMELVSFVEGEIGMPIPPTEITLENFDSVNRIVQFAQRLAAGRRDA